MRLQTYLLTRALSVPSILLMFVAVGCSLGANNSVAPALGVLAAAAARARPAGTGLPG